MQFTMKLPSLTRHSSCTETHWQLRQLQPRQRLLLCLSQQLRFVSFLESWKMGKINVISLQQIPIPISAEPSRWSAPMWTEAKWKSLAILLNYVQLISCYQISLNVKTCVPHSSRSLTSSLLLHQVFLCNLNTKTIFSNVRRSSMFGNFWGTFVCFFFYFKQKN